MKCIKKTSDRKQEFIEISGIKKDIGRNAVRSGLVVWGAELFSLVIRMGSMAALARCLLPEDFGMLAMVMSLTVFAERFKDIGLGDATIQAKEINHEQVSALFWINLLICIGLAIFIAFLSKAVAWFYGDPRLTAITLVLSSTFIFSGFVIQHQALLQRQLHFRLLATIKISSLVLSTIIAIAMAYYDFGYWALVGREFSRSVFDVIGTWIACPWIPNLPRRHVKIGKFVSFGKNVTGFNLAYFLARSIDRILLGKLQGPDWVGIYANAQQLITLPVSQIQSPVHTVALPALSSMQTDPRKFREYYENMVQLLIFVCMPIVVFLAIFADVIINMFLGPRWIKVIPIFQILAVGAFIEPLVHTTGPALVAYGKTRVYFKLGLANSLTLISCIVLGSIWGTVGVACGYATAMYLSFAICFSYGLKHTPIEIAPVLKKIVTTSLCSIITGIVLVGGRYIVGWSIGPRFFIIFLIGGPLFYLLIWIIVPSGRKMLLVYFYMLHSIVGPENVQKFIEKLKQKVGLSPS